MPRSVWRRVLREMLHCTSRVSSPCAANSSWHHDRANRPRSSARGSMSTTYAPGNPVSVNTIRASLLLHRPDADVLDLRGLRHRQRVQHHGGNVLGAKTGVRIVGAPLHVVHLGLHRRRGPAWKHADDAHAVAMHFLAQAVGERPGGMLGRAVLADARAGDEAGARIDEDDLAAGVSQYGATKHAARALADSLREE